MGSTSSVAVLGWWRAQEPRELRNLSASGVLRGVTPANQAAQHGWGREIISP